MRAGVADSHVLLLLARERPAQLHHARALLVGLRRVSGRGAAEQHQASSHSITVDVSLYDALRPLDFSCTSTTWMESQQPLIFFEPSPTADALRRAGIAPHADLS